MRGVPQISRDGRGRRQWANLFEITNRRDLALPYRLLHIHGLAQGEHYDKNVNQLVKNVAYEIRQPVTAVRRGDAHYLAIPASAPLPRSEQRLMPHVARLIPAEEAVLALDRLDAATAPIAVAFLQYSLRAPLRQDSDLWGSGRAYHEKRPITCGDEAADVDIYPGFVWNVVVGGDGRLFISVDMTVRFVDRLWLSERMHGDLSGYRGRSCLYHFGHQWYIVQMQNLTGASIAEQLFVPGDGAPAIDVYSYTMRRWRADMPPHVRDLDSQSPAILYRYPGNERQSYGALALCKHLYSTTDAAAQGMHHRAILAPNERFTRIARVVKSHFQGARLADQPLAICTEPLEITPRLFPVPLQRFGHDRVLAAARRDATAATDHVPLDRLGAKRLQLLQDPHAGPLDVTPFDAQYLILPQSLARAICDDIAARFTAAMRTVSGQQTYHARTILYDDRQARTLHQQVTALRQVIAGNGIDRGYALLVLPERAKPDLHNYIKKSLWPHLQFQCAMARKIQSYYVLGRNGAWQPMPNRERQLGSYVRNCALGMMVVNRKWAWALASPLHYDAYVGIDVLHGMAGLTFVYDHGRHIYFHDYKGRQQERLTTAQLRDILVTRLRADLGHLGLRPRSLVIHRDGHLFPSERDGLRAAMAILMREGVLPPDAVIGAVDIRKDTMDHLRIAEGTCLERCDNPTVGSAHVLGACEGIICTTGHPFRFPGTAQPLAVRIVEGELEIGAVLEDIFALSQPVFTAPDKCARLPLTIKLADDFLEPIAGAADEEAALYETETLAGDGEDDSVDLAADAGQPARRTESG